MSDYDGVVEQVEDLMKEVAELEAENTELKDKLFIAREELKVKVADKAELRATIEMWIKGAPISQHKCRAIPTPRELKLGIGAPVQCPKCRNAPQER